MRNLSYRSIFLTISLVIFTMVLSSCTKDNPVATNTTDDLNYVSFGTNFESIQISDATVDTDIKLLNEMQPQVVDKGGLFAGNMPMFNFRDIFRRLNLSDEQKDQIRAIMIEHVTCERAARLAYYQKIVGILQDANAQRKAIAEDLKNGVIDRQTAFQKIRDLNKSTREQIAESGANQELRAALKACTESMISEIKSKLTDEQLVKFNAWLERVKKG